MDRVPRVRSRLSALSSVSADGTVINWDVADLPHSSLRLRLEGTAGAIWAVAYSPDGATVAASSWRQACHVLPAELRAHHVAGG
jgi:hypothetical protein